MRRLLLTLGGAAALAVPAAAAAASHQTAFIPNDPLLSHQWYLAQTKAFDFWPQIPALPTVRVAVVDSGLDGGHPEFAHRVLASKSFVGGSPLSDSKGHGTFVAGEIAAAANNGQGIAGIAFPAQLLIAKVVGSDGSIPLTAEANAIRWAADRGARVINLSLAGLRDPLNPRRDSYSSLEAAAIRYAYRKGTLVVAAAGNADQAPRTPWNFAGYPAALPHVLGVSALTIAGDVPSFSNRDVLYDDISAPGSEIFSTLPRALTASRPSCPDQGYSNCGPTEFRHAEGTSFSAPMVTAAAALVLAYKPSLRPDQVAWILERAATDMTGATGCRACPTGRDRLSGWGRLDVNAALIKATAGPIPRGDTREPDDDAGWEASRALGARGRVLATIDYWDDPVDVYGLHLRRGQRLSVSVSSAEGVSSNLLLWKPGTIRVGDQSPENLRRRVAQSAHSGPVQNIRGYEAPVEGWYFVEVKADSKSSGPYSLRYRKSR